MTGEEVVELPAVSVAIAVIVWSPLPSPVASNTELYGLDGRTAPESTESTWN